jgi:hypothetical protein
MLIIVVTGLFNHVFEALDESLKLLQDVCKLVLHGGI